MGPLHHTLKCYKSKIGLTHSYTTPIQPLRELYESPNILCIKKAILLIIGFPWSGCPRCAQSTHMVMINKQIHGSVEEI